MDFGTWIPKTLAAVDRLSADSASYLGRHGMRDITATIRTYILTTTISFCPSGAKQYRLRRDPIHGHVVQCGDECYPINLPEYSQIELMRVQLCGHAIIGTGKTLITYAYLGRYDGGNWTVTNHGDIHPSTFSQYYINITDSWNYRGSAPDPSTIVDSAVGVAGAKPPSWNCNKHLYPRQFSYRLGKKEIKFPPGCITVRFNNAGRMLRLRRDGTIE